jgi:golgi phosphoprotein 3
MTMTIRASTRGAATVLAVHGRLDATTAPTLEAQVAEIAAAGAAQVVLECAALTYVSSAGLRAILLAARSATAAGGGLAVASVSPSVAAIFALAGLARVLPVTPTVDEAVQALASRPGAAPSAPPVASGDGQGLTLVEELVLLAIDERTGRVAVDAPLAFDAALAGAALAELAFMGRLDADTEQFLLVDSTPTGHPLLDPILAAMAADAGIRQVGRWIDGVSTTARGLLDQTLARLTAQGILHREDSTMLWVFRSRRYRTLDGRERDDVRSRLTALVMGDDVPDPRDAVLVSLARTSRLVDRAFTDPRARDRQDRIAAVSQLDLVGSEVSNAVERLMESLAIAMAIAH